MSANLKTIYCPEAVPTPTPNVDSALYDYQIDVLTQLAAGLLGEIERLRGMLAVSERDSDLVRLEQGQTNEAEMMGSVDFYAEIRRYEIDLIRRALRQARGSQTRAAKLLQMKTTTLNSKIKQYGICAAKLIFQHFVKDSTR
jgi:transcriptional regulator with GAF, ATPase, and Fis domain